MSVAIVGSAYVDIHAITDKVEKQISRAFEKIKDITVNVSADISAALSETEAVAEAIDSINTDINVEVDIDTSSVEAAVETIESEGADISVGADTQTARNDIEDLISDADGQQATISVNPMTAYAAARFTWLTRTRVVDFVAKINEKAFAKVATALASLSGGKDLLKKMESLGNYLLDIGSHAPKIAMVSTAIMGIGGAVSAALSNILVLGGSLAQIGMAGIALPGILMGFATGLVTMVVALKEAGTYLGDLKYLFTETKNVITGNFWEPAVGPIREMITTIMPAFNNSIGMVATSLGGFAAATANAIKHWVTANHLGYVMTNLSSSIDIAAGAMDPLIETFITFAQVGSEYLPDLAAWFVRIAETFNNWVNGVNSDGLLHAWIETGISAMFDLGKVVAETVKIFHGLYTAAEAAGGSTLATLGDALERIANIIETPAFQSTLISVFRGGHAAMDGMFSALGPLGDAFYILKDAIETSLGYAGEIIGTMGTNFATMIGQVTFGEGLVSMFAGIRSGAEALAPAMGPLGVALGALGNVIGAIVANSGPLLATVISAVAGPVTTLLTAVQPLIPVLGEALMGIVEALAPALETFAGALASALPGIVSFISFIADLTANIITGLGPVLPAVALAVLGVVSAMKLVGGAVTGVGLALTAFDKLKDSIETVRAVAGFIGPKLVSGFSSVVGTVSRVTAAFVASAAGQKIAAAAAAVFKGVMTALNVVLRLNPIGLIVTAIIALVAGVILAYNKIGWFKDFVNGAFELIKQGVQVLVDFWNNTLVPMFQTAMDKAQPFFDGIINLLGTIGEGAMAAFSGLVGFITGVVQGISEVITSVVTTISSWWNSTWTAISESFMAAWNGIVWFFEPLVNLIIAVVRFFVDTFMAIWNGVWPIIFAVFEGVWLKITEFFGPIIQGIVDVFHATIDGISAWWTGVWQGISDFFTTTWNNIVAFVTPIVAFIKEVITIQIEILKSWWDATWTAISTFFTTIWNNIVAFISPIITSISTSISSFVTGVQTVWNAVWGAISSFFSAIWTVISSVASSAMGILRNAISGALSGIQGVWNSVWSAISGFVSGVWNGIVNAVSGFVNSVRNYVTDVLNNMRNMGSDILNSVSNLPSLLINSGRDMINGLAQGIDNARHVVVNKIQEICAGALDAVKNFFGIKSPSRVMRDQVGLQIGYGLAIGIEKSMSRVEKASAALSDAAMIDAPTDITLPSITSGSVGVPVTAQLGGSASGSLSAEGAYAVNGSGGSMNFNVYPSAGLSETQIGEAAMEHMYWKISNS